LTTRTRNRNAAALAIGLAAVFGLLTALIVFDFGPLYDLDRTVAHWAYDANRDDPTVIRALKLIAAVSQPVFQHLAFGVVAVVLAVRGGRRTVLWIVLTTVVSWPAASLLKGAIERPRPSPTLADVGGYGFPSGHAAGAGTSAAMLILLTVMLLPRSRSRALLVGLWLALGLVVGMDRILLAVHSVSDVVGGWALGAFLALGAYWLLRVDGADLRWHPSAVQTVGTPPRRPRLAVVLNPTKVDNPRLFKRKVVTAAARYGWEEPIWFETTVDDAGRSMTHAALAAGADVVMVAGGDGTVRVVCGELAGTGVPAGIVPAGTGNLLARNLGLPLTVDAALQVVLTGGQRAVDIVRIEGDELPEDHYVVMAGLGLDAAIMAGAPEHLKARMGWPAYVVAAARHVRYPAIRVEITVDGGPVERYRARTVVIGNVGYLQAGIPLLPDAAIDDGLLDVVVIAPRRTLGWFALVARVMLRRRQTDDRLDRMTGRSVVVRAASPTPRQLDGDTVGAGRELHATVEAGGLLVRVPAGPVR
jgi:diacylglycerol kinase family enzyme/membrane-associated phospholipid phosphatase